MKHLLSACDLDKSQAIALLDRALEFSQIIDSEKSKLPSLAGRTIVNLFFEDSTRTKLSFEIAAKKLAAQVVNFSPKGSSLSKGESLKDTVQTLEALGVDAFVIRHQASGAAHLLANSGWVDSSVINAGDGTHEHPTQALIDALTLRNSIHQNTEGRDLSGMKILIAGDIRHSRVARSNIHLLDTLGAEIHIAGPATLIPDKLMVQSRTHLDFDAAITSVSPDAVMMLRVQQERMASSFFPSAREYSRLWGLNQARFSRLDPKCLILHPGPINRGLEIDSLVADSGASQILKQVRNGIFVRMAVLFELLSGKG